MKLETCCSGLFDDATLQSPEVLEQVMEFISSGSSNASDLPADEADTDPDDSLQFDVRPCSSFCFFNIWLPGITYGEHKLHIKKARSQNHRIIISWFKKGRKFQTERIELLVLSFKISFRFLFSKFRVSYLS